MKVFEVLTETTNSENSKIVETRQYVTSESDSLLTVTKYYTRQCKEYCLDLKSVREILVVSTCLGKEWDE